MNRPPLRPLLLPIRLQGRCGFTHWACSPLSTTENDCVQLLSTSPSCFVAGRYLLTKTWENRNKSGGLIQIISFWTTFTPPSPMPAVFEQLDFISGTQPVRQQNLRRRTPPHLISAQQVQFWLRCTDPRSKTHSTAHIRFKSFRPQLWSVLSNMRGTKQPLFWCSEEAFWLKAVCVCVWGKKKAETMKIRPCSQDSLRVNSDGLKFGIRGGFVWVKSFHRARAYYRDLDCTSLCLFLLARGLSSTVDFTFNAMGRRWQPCWMRIAREMHREFVGYFSAADDRRGKS